MWRIASENANSGRDSAWIDVVDISIFIIIVVVIIVMIDIIIIIANHCNDSNFKCDVGFLMGILTNKTMSS